MHFFINFITTATSGSNSIALPTSCVFFHSGPRLYFFAARMSSWVASYPYTGDTLQEENFHRNLNFAISQMTNLLNCNSMYYYIFENISMIAYYIAKI